MKDFHAVTCILFVAVACSTLAFVAARGEAGTSAACVSLAWVACYAASCVED